MTQVSKFVMNNHINVQSFPICFKILKNHVSTKMRRCRQNCLLSRRFHRQVRDAFLQIDKDRSGTITINERLSKLDMGSVKKPAVSFCPLLVATFGLTRAPFSLASRFKQAVEANLQIDDETLEFHDGNGGFGASKLSILGRVVVFKCFQ